MENFKNLTDEKLIELYKAGDEQALDFLLDKYKYLASRIARSYFLIGAEHEDLLQEAMLGLYSACRNYSSELSSFKAFASLCITRAVQTAVKTANRQKNKYLNESLTLTGQGSLLLDPNNEEDEDLQIFIPSNAIDPLDAYIKQENKLELEKLIEENLSKKEKAVLSLYLKGLSYVQIANALGETTKSVDNAISRTKKKLEELI